MAVARTVAWSVPVGGEARARIARARVRISPAGPLAGGPRETTTSKQARSDRWAVAPPLARSLAAVGCKEA